MSGWCPLVYLCLLCFGFSEVTGQEEWPPRLDTKYGQLMGRQIQVKDSTKTVLAYLGIPFAEPPVGELRFFPPVPPREWQGVRDATVYPPMCLQNMNHTGQLGALYAGRFPPLKTSEDCLYLNVYTPVKPGQTKRLPVMVWIHGGGFLMGGATLYDGSSLAAFGDVVVVIIQYRLGIPGFMSTGETPENLGLMDQVFALHWVQETIHSFGGDPGSVTIFGESAGGSSVFVHMLSPVSTGLFHRAITQSGGVLLPLFIQNDVRLSAKVIAKKAGCAIDDPAGIMKCLKGKTAEEIEVATPRLGDFVLSISADGEFVPKDTEDIGKMNFKNVPWIIGTTNHEFGWLLPHLILFPGWEHGMSRQVVRMTLALLLQKSGFPENAQEIIEDEYFGDTEDPTRVRDILLDLLGDLAFVSPSVKAARDHRDAGSPVFFYEFQQRPSVYGHGRPDFVKVDHFDDVGFVFGAPFWTEEIVTLEASKCEIRQKVWDYMETMNLANFPRPVHNRIPNFKGAERACAHVSNLEIFHRTSEVKVDPDKPLEGARLAVLQAGKTLLVPTPRLRTGLLNKIVPPQGAGREDLRVCSTSQGVKDFSVPIGLDAKMTVELLVVGSVAVSEKGYRIGKGEGYSDMEYAMMVSVGAVKDPLVVSVVHDCQIMDIPEGLIESHDLTVDYILTPTRVIKTECKRPKPQGIIWTKLTPAMLEKIPILKKLRSLEQQAGKDVTLGGASAGREAEAVGRGPDGEDRAPERGVTTSVFLGGLPPGLRVSELKSALRERGAGPLRLNWQGAQRRAFLDYSDRPAAEAALHALQGLSINGKSVQVELARSQRGGGKKGGPARDRAQTGPGPETRTVT